MARSFRLAAGMLMAALMIGPLQARAQEESRLAAQCPAVSRAALALPAGRAALREGRALTILAFGSSSTEGSGASAPRFRYPDQLEARLRAAGIRAQVVNKGRGGEDVDEMLPRLGGTLAAVKPDLVIWQAGANAAMRAIEPAHFEAMMRQGIAQIRATGADLVLMDNQRSPRILGIRNHALFDDTLARLAKEQGASLFSRFALMAQWEAQGLTAARSVGADGVHHTDLGYTCLAAALADGMIAALRGPALVAGR